MVKLSRIIKAGLFLIVMMIVLGMPTFGASEIAHWTCDEGAGVTCADSGAGADNITCTAGVAWGKGIFGQEIRPKETNNCISTTLINYATASYCMWLNMTTFSTGWTIGGLQVDANNRIVLMSDTSPNIKAYAKAGGTAITTPTWAHPVGTSAYYCISCNNSMLRVTKNNTLVANVAWAKCLDDFVGGALMTLSNHVGGQSNAGGYEDEIRYFDFLLTSQNITNLMSINNLQKNLSSFQIRAKNCFDASTIFNFSSYLYNTTWSDTFFSNVTTGVLETSLNRTTPTLFNMTISSGGYLNKSINMYNISSNLLTCLNPSNQLTVYIRNEDTNNLILENISVTFYSDTYLVEYSTLTGIFYTNDIPNGAYVIRFESANYSTRYYNVTFNNSAHLYMNVYLVNSTLSTTMTTVDSTTGKLLPDTSITMYRFINGSWVVVESHITDISARASFSYLKDIQYKFFISKQGYLNKEFTLDPIEFSEYTIKMEKSSSSYEMPAYVGVDVTYEPRIFYANYNNNFSFIVQSSEGLLSSYGFIIEYPSGNVTKSGNNAHGQAWDVNFTIGNTGIYETVNLTYYYTTSQTGYREYRYYFEIINEGVIGNYTLAQNMEKTYGMGIFERVLVSTLIVIFVAGIGTMVAGGIIGGFLGLIVLGYLTYIGFIPYYLIIISMITGFFLLLWRSE